MKPWEKFQNQPQQEQGPWNKFRDDSPEKIINEMPEGLQGRFVAKNFGADTEATFNYLQKVNPDFEFKKDADGEVLARKRGAKDWGRLDPEGLDLRDLTDVAYDIPAGVAQGVATTIGGLKGAVLGFGVGALPAAAAYGTGSGVALEGIRQGIGRMAGIEDNASGKDLFFSGAMGAASPFLLGTGATTKQVAKQALDQGLSAQAARKMAESQRGYLGKAVTGAGGAAGKFAANVIGGYDPKVLEAAYSNLDLIKATKDNPKLAVDLLSDGREKIISGVQTNLRNTGQQLEFLTKSLDQEGAVIPTKEILQPVRDLQAKLKSTGIQSDERKALIARLESIIDDNFAIKTVTEPELSVDQRLAIAAGIAPVEKIPEAVTEKKIPEFLTATQANEAYFALKGLAADSGIDLSKLGTLKGSMKEKGTVNDKRVGLAFNEAMRKAKDKVRDVASRAGVADEYTDLNREYAELKDFQKIFNTATRDEEAYQRFLKKPGKTAEYMKQKISATVGEDVDALGAKLQAVEIFSDPKWQLPNFGQSTTERTALGGTIGGTAGYMIGRENQGQTFLPTMIGAALGTRMASPKVVRGVMSTGKALEQIPQRVPGGTAYYPYLMYNTMQDPTEGQ